MATGETLIQLEGVTKVFYTDEVETHALAGIHLEIRKGDYIAIAGPSGCGKSTLLSILGLLDSPTEGRYVLNGKEVQHSPTDLLIYSIPQIIAFCFDFTALTAGDIIATGTPEGIGARRTPPVWMKAGDVLEVEISGIGTLRYAW